jgi:hypothetical protein
LEDETFGLKGINIFNVIINYIYLGLLLMCFILSLGNRPQGAKWFYTTAMIGFALITVYMTVCGFLPFVSSLVMTDRCPLVCRVLLSRQGYSEHRSSRDNHPWKYLYEQYLPKYRAVVIGYAWVVHLGFVDFRRCFSLAPGLIITDTMLW